MRRLAIALLGIILGIWMLGTTPALAEADLAKGAQVFSSNCAACHIGGGNLVNPTKTLQKADLEQYQMNSIDAIKNQVINGKLGMPAFEGRLATDQIEAVAAYVLDQAEKGW